MKCHYETLEVPRDADDSQIKTAYRKLALRWHPDKNLNDPELAKEQFQLVQQAYEILSDRQERAWYDNHREQILHGSNVDFEDDSLDVFQYFTTTCFKGYGDDEAGFYTVYRKVFDEIIKEDIKYMEDKEEYCEIPAFGMSTSDYEETVGAFYAYWTSYSTKKSYVWLDPYNMRETRDRKIVKLMEKENKKVRQKAKKERNEEIRALVAFVKKRDKRVQEHARKMEAKVLENRQKQEKLSKQKRMERKKLLHESSTQAEWSKFDNVKTELEQIERNLAEEFGEDISEDDTEDVENEIIDNLYCVACNKIFKTEKAFQNHEASKKHKENTDKLKKTMLDNEESDSINSKSDLEEMQSDFNSQNDSNSSDSESVEKEAEARQKKKQKKAKNVIREHFVDDEQFSMTEENASDILRRERLNSDDFNFDMSNSKNKKRKSKKTPVKVCKEDDVGNLQNQTNESNPNVSNEPVMEKQKADRKGKQGKADKHERKEAKTGVDVDINHYCVSCKANFPSKNKLFDHLKKTGHSVYLPQNNTPINLKSKKKCNK